MQKLFENWRKFVNEAEDEPLREPVPEYLFPNARQDMLKAYEEGGINRQVFINKIERELMPILASTGTGGPLSSVGIYEKFIFPQILKAVNETPVYIEGDFPCDPNNQAGLEAAKAAYNAGPGHEGPRSKFEPPISWGMGWHQKGTPDDFAGGYQLRRGKPDYAILGKIFIGCRFFRSEDDKYGFDHGYDKPGHRAYNVFIHEMGHAIDGNVALPTAKWLLSRKHKSLEKWFRGKKKRRRKAKRSHRLSRRQKNIIGLLFPVTISKKKNKGHSEKTHEIYTNITGLRSLLGRPYQAEDIAKLKSHHIPAFWAWAFELPQDEELRSISGLPSGPLAQILGDLRNALRNSINQDLTDQQIADLLNQVV